MSTYGWIVIICILIWVVVIFLFKNSYDSWEDTYSKEYKCWKRDFSEEDKLTAPLWMYILVAISTLCPVLNIIAVILASLALIAGYVGDAICLHIELPEKLKFLTKEY